MLKTCAVSWIGYVLDLWAEQWRKTRARGEVILVRYADDFVVGFQYESDARRFLEELRERFRQFNLELHAEKTRVIEFGRFAAATRERREAGKPHTFNFLGFTHVCDKTLKGAFMVLRRTMAQRMRAKIRSIRAQLWQCLHEPVEETGRWLARVVSGHYRYYGVPRNLEALSRFRLAIYRAWRAILARRSDRALPTREQYAPLVARWLALPRVCHPYPSQRLAVFIQGKSPMR